MEIFKRDLYYFLRLYILWKSKKDNFSIFLNICRKLISKYRDLIPVSRFNFNFIKNIKVLYLRSKVYFLIVYQFRNYIYYFFMILIFKYLINYLYS